MNNAKKTEIHNEIFDLLAARNLSPYEAVQIIIATFISFGAGNDWTPDKFNEIVDSLKLVYKRMVEKK